MNPLGPPASVRKTIADFWRDIAHYPDPAARELRERLAARHKIPAGCILAGNGAAELIDLVIRYIAPRTILVTAPSFGEYRQAALNAGAVVRELRLSREEQFVLTPRCLREGFQQCDLLILGHPNNPTGRRLPRETVDMIMNSGIPVVLDEAFLDFSADEEQVTLIRAAAENHRLFVIRSMTKFFSIPGIRLGYMAASSENIAALKKLQVPWSVNALAQKIGAEVLREQEFIARTKQWLPAERGWFAARLAELGLDVFPSEANFLLFSIPPAWNTDIRSLQRRMGRRGILVRDASLFSGLDHSYGRAAVRLRHENERFLTVLKEVLS
jgi:histidinol-phosphate aminotransferase